VTVFANRSTKLPDIRIIGINYVINLAEIQGAQKDLDILSEIKNFFQNHFALIKNEKLLAICSQNHKPPKIKDFSVYKLCSLILCPSN